jgi:hypothetical protein
LRDEFERAVEMGRRNAELISLGKAWCTHIRNDRGPLGVGLLEQQTGLPIAGGRFTCDYARNPVQMFGMDLAVSALDFYEHNCPGCPYRAPGNRVPNLSTWAEPQLAERERIEHERQAAAQAARVDRERRAAHRRIVTAQLSAAAQGLVELLNRLDGDAGDAEAAESLTASARLTPEAFTPEVREILLTDTVALSSSEMLDALVSLDEAGVLSDDPRLRGLARRAMEDGWGRQAAARYLLSHGEGYGPESPPHRGDHPSRCPLWGLSRFTRRAGSLALLPRLGPGGSRDRCAFAADARRSVAAGRRRRERRPARCSRSFGR